MQRSSGSIGIGAMIVFIALILVAAVASTIIIKSVEDLSVSSDKSRDDRQFSKIEISDVQVFLYEPCWQSSDSDELDCGDSGDPHQGGHHELIMLFSLRGEMDLQADEVHYQVSCEETRAFQSPIRTVTFDDSDTWDSRTSTEQGWSTAPFNRGAVVLPGQTEDTTADAIGTLEPGVDYAIMIDLLDNQNSVTEDDDEGCRITREYLIHLTLIVEGGLDTFAVLECEKYTRGSSCY